MIPRLAQGATRMAVFMLCLLGVAACSGTGVLNAEQVRGLRYDFGYIEDHKGWLFSILNLNEQSQKIMASDVPVVFQDAPFGSPPVYHLQGYIDTDLLVIDDLPVRFDELTASYKVKTWGVELSCLHRMHPNHCGGILEWFVGARYLEINDVFSVNGIEYIEGDDPDDPVPAAGLGDSVWHTQADNHIVGPQVGARYFRKTGRWTWSTEGRFFAGFNSQNVTLEGTLGSHLGPDVPVADLEPLKIINMAPTSFNHSKFFPEWSPAAELRVDLTYQMTRALSFGVGWTGFWIDGIARSPSLIDYSLGQDSAMGITGVNRQDVFMNGINFTVELNR